MYFGPYLDTVNLRERRLLEKNVIRLSKIQSDIVFLSRCKKFDIIPKGLRLKNPFKFQSNSLCIKGNYTCEKAELILRNTAINDAYRKQRLLEKEINTSRAILQREYPLEYEETADFINKQFERHKEMFFERKMKKFHSLCNQHPILNAHCVDKQADLLEAQTNVANLSDYKLSEEHFKLLEHGLSFCPTRKYIDRIKICHDNERFCRNIRLHEYFPSRTINYTSSVKTNKSWTPPEGRSEHIDSLIKKVRNHYNNLITNIPTDTQNNLSTNQRTAMKELSSNTNIVVKEADKGGAITIINTSDYITDCVLLLNDAKTYQTTSSEIIDIHMTEAENLVKTLADSNRQISHDLLPDQLRAGIFYGLPKLHKLKLLIHSRLIDNSLNTPVNLSSISDIITEATKLNIRPPYRPIVSCIGTIAEHISGFVDSILQPLLKKIPSYLKDTTHFIRNLSYIGTLAPGSILISMDVNSLYTNIPHADGVAACRAFLNKHSIQSDIATDIHILIDFILKHNTFTFNDKYYLQTNGTAMGTKMAPAYAIIFMESVENSFLSSFPHKPTVYYRYIDDIFMIWSHGIDKFEQFFRNANNTHPSITFTYEASTALPFLDVLTKINNDNAIYTTVNCKPTDRHSYLHYKSNHPIHLKHSIIFSQFLRYKRICSDHRDFTKCSKELTHRFFKNGLPNDYY